MTTGAPRAGGPVPGARPEGADVGRTVDRPAGLSRHGRGGVAAAVAFLVALVAGGALRAWQLSGRGVLVWNDTADFLTLARSSWLDADLWAGGRPPAVPMVLKLLDGDVDRYMDVQAGIATVCWAALCASVASVVAPRWPRVVAVAAVLAFSLTTPVAMWERSILSESPGVSALALLAAAGVQLARGVSWPRAALVGATLVPWLAVRDTHVVVAVGGGVAALVVAGAAPARRRVLGLRRRPAPAATEGDDDGSDARVPAPTAGNDGGLGRTVPVAGPRGIPPAAERDEESAAGGAPLAAGDARTGDASRAGTGGSGWRRPLAALGAAAVALGLLATRGADNGERQAFPTSNLYEVRVLPYPDRVRWFADHGMPQADVFLGPDARTPSRQPGLAPVVYVGEDDPELVEWNDWVADHGQAAFVRYVAAHPGYLVTEPLRVPERTFNNALGDREFYRALDHREVPLVDRLLDRPTTEVLVVAALAVGWAIGRRRVTPPLVTGAVAVALAVPHGAVAWHSDGMETARHLMIPALQLHLGVVLLLVGMLPAAGVRHDDRAAPEQEGAAGVRSSHG